MPPTQCILSSEIRPVTKPSRCPYVVSTRCRSLGGTQGRGQGDPKGYPKGSQGDPKGPKGTQRGDGAKGTQGGPWGRWAHGALWGYSEAISNERHFRMEGYYECKDVPKRKLIWNAQK